MRFTGCYLSHRGVLRIRGADRTAFLQGLISNDIGLCAPGQSLYAALLTPQGKFLFDLFLYDNGDAYLVDCEAERRTELLQKLSMYKLRAQVVLEDVSEKFGVWGMIDHPLPDGMRGGCAAPDPRLAALGLRGVFENGVMPELIPLPDPTAYDRLRLGLGIPEGSRDMVVGKSSLADGNFDFMNGISWTKGCYIGQELTARMHHRALVKKRLFPVHIKGVAPPPGSILRYGQVEAGEMRSSRDWVGLAFLSVERLKVALQEGKGFEHESAVLTPYVPDWIKI